MFQNSLALYDVDEIRSNIDLIQEQESEIQALRDTNAKQGKRIVVLESFHNLGK